MTEKPAVYGGQNVEDVILTVRGQKVILDTVNRSQFATGSQKHRDPRFRPYVFTVIY